MISLVVAISKNNIIGKDNSLPWHYSEDLKYFKNLTLHHTILMGRNTFESILKSNKKPLPERSHIVVTRNKDYSYPGVTIIHDLKSFLEADHDEEVFVIGGKQIFEIALPFSDTLYITRINKEFDGDVEFPKYDPKMFRLVSEKVSGELTFQVYERIKN